MNHLPRHVRAALRMPLFLIIGTEAARDIDQSRKSAAHLAGWQTRRAIQRANDPVLRECGR